MPEPSLDQFLRQVRDHLHAEQARAASDAELLRRFARHGEGTAFAVILERHGPLVLGVCRRLLGSSPDAEDAFQATFLVLVRKAAALRQWGSLANWLHRVAYRVALDLKVRADRRRQRQRPLDAAAEPAVTDAEPGADLRLVLDEELQQLPDKYRAPLVLCYLEGRTMAEAARELGWPEGTVSGRMARGRDLLRQRLGRRGVGPLAAPAIETVPAALGEKTLALLAGTMRGMTMTPLRTTAALLVSLLVLGGGLALVGAASRPARPAVRAAPAPAVVGLDAQGDRLPRGAVARLGSARLRHAHAGAVTFSPDGKTLASAGLGGAILWDRGTGRALHRFSAGQGRRIAFSADGSRLALAGDELLSLWDVKSGRVLRRIPLGGRHSIEALGFSADGLAVTLVLAVGVRSWSVESGKEQPRPAVTLPPRSSGGIVIAPAGGRLALLGCNSPLRLLDLAGGKERLLLTQPKHHLGGGHALSPDGRWLAAAIEPEIHLFDLSAGREVRRLATPFGEAPRTLALSDDGKQLVAVGLDRPHRQAGAQTLLVLFDAVSGKELRRLPLRQEAEEDEVRPRQLVFSRDGRTLAGLAGPTIQLWDTKSGRKLHAGGNYHQVEAIAFAGDGRSVATRAWGSPVVRVWDAATGRKRFQVPSGSFSLSADGKTLLTTSGPALRLWEGATGKERARWDAHTTEEDSRHASRAAFTPDGAHIVSVGAGSGHASGGTIRVWDGRGRAVRTVGPVGHLLTVSANGKCALAYNADWGTKDDGVLFVWDLESGRLSRATGPLGGVRIVPRDPALLSPDGKTVAIPDYATGLLALWDVRTGRQLHALRRGGNESVRLAFTPDGKTLASCQGAEVQLWDTATGRQRGTLAPGQGSIQALAFSADGRRLGTGGSDATTLIWDVVTAAVPPDSSRAGR